VEIDTTISGWRRTACAMRHTARGRASSEAAVAVDADRLTRFQREAEVLAALNRTIIFNWTEALKKWRV
jgi:hypothetical protein